MKRDINKPRPLKNFINSLLMLSIGAGVILTLYVLRLPQNRNTALEYLKDAKTNIEKQKDEFIQKQSPIENINDYVVQQNGIYFVKCPQISKIYQPGLKDTINYLWIKDKPYKKLTDQEYNIYDKITNLDKNVLWRLVFDNESRHAISPLLPPDVQYNNPDNFDIDTLQNTIDTDKIIDLPRLNFYKANESLMRLYIFHLYLYKQVDIRNQIVAIQNNSLTNK